LTIIGSFQITGYFVGFKIRHSLGLRPQERPVKLEKLQKISLFYLVIDAGVLQLPGKKSDILIGSTGR
jgi:hypothetical protein